MRASTPVGRDVKTTHGADMLDSIGKVAYTFGCESEIAKSDRALMSFLGSGIPL